MENEFKSLEDKIDSRILEARRIFFSHPVDSDSARDAIRKLWYLELENPGQPILFVINCPGGSIDGSDKDDHLPDHHASNRSCGFDGFDPKPCCQPQETVCHA